MSRVSSGSGLSSGTINTSEQYPDYEQGALSTLRTLAALAYDASLGNRTTNSISISTNRTGFGVSINISAYTLAGEGHKVSIQPQASPDGTTWYNYGSPTESSATAALHLEFNIHCKWFRLVHTITGTSGSLTIGETLYQVP